VRTFDYDQLLSAL